MARSLLTCQSCWKRSLNGLTSEESSYLPRASLPYHSISTFPRATRRYHGNQQGQNAKAVERRKVAKALIRKPEADPYGPVSELTESQKRNLRSELKYLPDRLKLANHIQHVLEHDAVDKALALVRLSSRALENAVSWNHIIDWHMKKGKTKAALEVYNELKKRGQKPDSHTYLLLLRGLAEYAHHPHSLGRALSLYHSMSAPHNKVAPTIIHTNCVLKVCARANDMDSLWDIASRLPESGPHAANTWTFTTILNNMRMNAITGGISAEETSEASTRRKEEAIVQGRRLWDLVARRWRAGDLYIDEELACSMGRLLLVGSRPRDWDDVLSLLRQTMALPRLVSKLGTTARPDVPVPRINNSESLPKREESTEQDSSDNTDAFDVFNPSTSSRVTKQTQLTVKASQIQAYAKPGPSTLSLILEACLKMAAKRASTDYWNLLTDPTGRYAIVPDLDNMHMRLRILRQSHSSAEVAALVRDDIPAAKLKPVKKTFTIAMSACVRDNRNSGAPDTAGRVLDAAMEQIAEPSARTLRLYLECVQAAANVVEHTHAGAVGTSTASMSEEAKLGGLRNAVRMQLHALNRLEPGTVPLKTMLRFGEDPQSRPAGRSRADWEEEVKRERTDALDLMKRMIAAYDRVLGLCQGREKEMGITPSDRQKCVERKKKLGAFVTRQHNKDVKSRVQRHGWRALGKGEGRAGWRVGSTGGNEDGTEVVRPRRLEDAAASA